jgi:cytochrome c peroxidase
MVPRRLVRLAALLLLGGVLVGCQRAGRYEAYKPAATTEKGSERDPRPPQGAQPLPPLDDSLAWMRPRPSLLLPETKLVFVHEETDREEWNRLREPFWNVSRWLNPASAATLPGLSPYTVAVLAAEPNPPVIKVKVPRGLPDPSRFVPPENALTLAKWELGRRLFFDKTWLDRKEKISCATCHDPMRGFTDGLKDHSGFNTPTLLNVVYNSYQFWDGRATRLEEVVQRTLEDEREIATAKDEPFQHVWHGVVTRLKNDFRYIQPFDEAFGTPPTQDAIGKALATYLRTLLGGDSLFDRARYQQAQRKGMALEAGDFEKVLDATALKVLGREGKKSAEVAAELQLGYRLFHNMVPDRQTHCSKCHSGGNFTDNSFHNIGIGYQGGPEGRQAHVPIGQKDARWVGAFKTPTLRALPRTGPYFHTGEMDTLIGTVLYHTEHSKWNPSLDELLRDQKNPNETVKVGLTDDQVQALVLFLRSLDGSDVDPHLKAPLGPVE